MDIRGHVTPDACVFFSGGIDSLLVLDLVSEINPEIPVVTFAADFDKALWKQFEGLILERGLTLYTYPPSHRYFVPNGEELSLIDEYGYGGITIPVIRDIEDGERCAFDLSAERMPTPDIYWTKVFTGVLKGDSHSLSKGNPFLGKEVTEHNGITFISPLYNWTKAEVIAEANKRGLTPIEGTGEISACIKCLLHSETYCPKEQQVIKGVKWDADAMLKAFQQKYYGSTDNSAA